MQFLKARSLTTCGLLSASIALRYWATLFLAPLHLPSVPQPPTLARLRRRQPTLPPRLLSRLLTRP
jgi:hypothetical protein